MKFETRSWIIITVQGVIITVQGIIITVQGVIFTQRLQNTLLFLILKILYNYQWRNPKFPHTTSIANIYQILSFN